MPDEESTPAKPVPPALALARQAVANIEAILAGGAIAQGVKKYKIAGASGGSRELERYSMGELLSLLKYWRSRLVTEERKYRGTRPANIRYAL